jgi:hypothetical protein
MTPACAYTRLYFEEERIPPCKQQGTNRYTQHTKSSRFAPGASLRECARRGLTLALADMRGDTRRVVTSPATREA